MPRPDESSGLQIRLRGGLCSGLSGLLLQTLAGDANAFLLIRIGGSQPAEVGDHLADQGAVGAGNSHVGLLIYRDLNSLRYRELDRVRIAQAEDDCFAFQLGAITDTDDVHFLLETSGYTRYRIGHQGAGESMQRFLAVIFA